ncbi:dispanin subfamily A member 2b-like [Eublepharis macularius]|uniref:Dispanin subfamily A member 2b-like n=1 Tax=Eublepharis macularius TaxID=481883 RepID=A0AA97IYE2_EUBMA|nr:dispanin subfamily A member 2b-like [Eublepharis macularius]
MQSASLNMQPYDAKDQGAPAPPYAYPRGAVAPALPARQPQDYVLWSLFNFVFMNACCLGFAAVVFSFKSRDRKVVGDAEGATSYGNTAKSLNIAALILSILFFIIIIILIATGAIAMQHLAQQMREDHRNTLDDYFQRNGK